MLQNGRDVALVWHGDIELPGVPALNVKFHAIKGADAPDNCHVSAISNQTLMFLGLVDPARIPLHMAAGASMLVEAGSSETFEQLAAVLRLPAKSHMNSGTFIPPECLEQSDVALLLKVAQTDSDAQRKPHPRVTEILIYGVYQLHGTRTSICAFPLSSDLLHPVSAPDPSAGLDLQDTQRTPHFDLPHTTDDFSIRKTRLDDLFDAASNKRNKAKQNDATSMGIAASTGAPATPARAFDGKQIKAENEDRDLSRPSSRGHRVELLSTQAPNSPQPTTQKHRREPPSVPGAASTLGKPTVGSNFEDVSTESRNRQAISRIVMAGMRIYGLQQRNKISENLAPKHGKQKDSIAVNSQDATSQNSDERHASDAEYKAVYHQVFKGTVFAFRHDIEAGTLETDAIREVVDRLLALFCSGLG